MRKIAMYLIGDNGDGHVTSIGLFDDIEEIQIYPGYFAPNTKIEFNYEEAEEESNA
jgi:hypothetical protein